MLDTATRPELSMSEILKRAEGPKNLDRSPLLIERETTHGDFSTTALVAQYIKHILRHDTKRWKALPDRQKEALDMIATKMARIVSGNSREVDHWKDIDGYSKLGLEACTEPQTQR